MQRRQKGGGRSNKGAAFARGARWVSVEAQKASRVLDESGNKPTEMRFVGVPTIILPLSVEFREEIDQVPSPLQEYIKQLKAKRISAYRKPSRTIVQHKRLVEGF